MAYTVTYDRHAIRQKAGLPQDARNALDSAESRLASDPWGCTRPAGGLKEMRRMSFGRAGLLTVTIQVGPANVVVIDITWAG